MSPSKKANKKEALKQSKSAQKQPAKVPARSSRVATNNVQTKTRKSAATNKTSTKMTRVTSIAREIEAKPAQAPFPVKNTTFVQDQIKIDRPKTSVSTNLLRIIALLGVIGITVYIYSIRERVAEFEQFGYAGIFLIALMANATVLLPAPGVAIIYAMGAVFNPLWVGLAAGTGGGLGELSGYLAGFSGQAMVERTDIYNRFKPWVDKFGGWAILVLSAIPNPFFDVAGIAAGIAKMPIRTFLIFTWVGQIIKMTSFAVAGHYSLEWIAKFMN